VSSYELVLSEAAARVFVEASRSDQRRLGIILDELKSAPFRRGDLQETDANGRVHEIFVVGDWIVTCWADHAAKEMRLVRLETVGD
jgi:hypothetical protein